MKKFGEFGGSYVPQELKERLDELLVLCKDQLLERFEIQCNKRNYNFPFLLGQGVWIDSDNLSDTDDLTPAEYMSQGAVLQPQVL